MGRLNMHWNEFIVRGDRQRGSISHLQEQIKGIIPGTTRKRLHPSRRKKNFLKGRGVYIYHFRNIKLRKSVCARAETFTPDTPFSFFLLALVKVVQSFLPLTLFSSDLSSCSSQVTVVAETTSTTSAAR